MKIHRILILPLLSLCLASPAAAQEQVPPQLVENLDRLRQGLSKAYEAGDTDAMLKYLHPSCAVTFPDGRVLEGPAALRDYVDGMTKGGDAVVRSFTSAPSVDARTLFGNTLVSHGKMNDRYVLTDGTAFELDSVFTAALVRDDDGPAETGGWTIRAFHCSADAFDNPVLSLAVRKTATWSVVGGVVGGLLVGLVVGAAAAWLLIRRRLLREAPPAAA